MQNQNEQQIFFVIPARYGSTRLPGKPLLKIGARTLIERTVERAQLCAIQTQKLLKLQSTPLVLVATDDERIASIVRANGTPAVMTPSELPSGTDRIHRALELFSTQKQISEDALVVNVQGDEPFFAIDDLIKLTKEMHIKPSIPMGTLAYQRHGLEHFCKSNVVKVAIGEDKTAIYFSRAPIPWPRDVLGASGIDWFQKALNPKDYPDVVFWHHLGVYVYRRSFLRTFATELKSGFLEAREGLEQLRALEAGYKILVETTLQEPFDINTPEDLEAACFRLGEVSS